MGPRDQMFCLILPGWRGTPAVLADAQRALEAALRMSPHVHFCSLAVLPPSPGTPASAPSLSIELAIDEDVRPADVVAQLAEHGFAVLAGLCRHIAPAPAALEGDFTRRALLRYLLTRINRAAGAYVGMRDRSLRQIHAEARLFERTRAALRTFVDADAERAEIAQRIADSLATRDVGVDHAPAPQSLWRRLPMAVRVVLAGVIVLGVLVALLVGARSLDAPWRHLCTAGALLYGFVLLVAAAGAIPPLARWLDRAGSHEVARAHQVHRTIEACEARLIGSVSHMISVTEIRRPYWFHGTALRFWLAVITLAGRIFATDGRLGKAEGIHFGHWHILDGTRLVFYSNFDGSFGGYLDEFIRGATRGVNLVWRWTELLPRGAAARGDPRVSTARRFPPTRLGAYGGCTNELWFKTYARESMVPYAFRFSAYRLSNADIDRATRLRDALFGERTLVNDDRIMRALES